MEEDRKARLEHLLEEIEREGKTVGEASEELKNYPAKLVFEGKKKYELLKSDGASLGHTGWFVSSGQDCSISELFFAFSKIMKDEREYEKTLPYLLIFSYRQGGVEKSFLPLDEMDKFEMGDFVAKVSKGTIAGSSIPTQMDLETAVELLEGEVDIGLKEVFSEIKGKVSRYIQFSNPLDEDVVVLWIIATYFSDVFNVMPSLFILGSAGCGKTRLTGLITSFARRGFLITDPTDSNLPRIIEGYRPSLGIDDLDKIMRRHFPVIMSLLKHTYKRTVQVPRLERTMRDSFVLNLFSPFCPLVMNSTEPIRETQLFTRMIEVKLEKEKRKFPKKEPDVWYGKDERKKLYRARFLLAPKIYKIYERTETGFQGRDDEIWSPILAVAKLIDNGLFEDVREYAHRMAREKQQELYQEENIIIQAVQNLLAGRKEARFTASELSREMKKILVDERQELTEAQFDRYWSPRRVGRICERMNIPQKRRGREGVRERVVRRDFLGKLKDEFADNTDIADSNVDIPENKKLSEMVLKGQKNGVSEASPSSGIPDSMSETSAMSAGFSKTERILKLIGGGITYAELERKARKLGVGSDDLSSLIDKMIEEGIVFEPRPGLIKRL